MGRSSYDKLGPDVEYGYDAGGYGEPCPTPCAGWERHDRAMRQGFLQKVLTIVFVQLLVTAGICGAMAGIAPIRASLLAGDAGPLAGFWMFVCFAPALFLAGTFVAQACTRCAAGGGPVFDVLRAHPWNLVWLFAFTVLEGLSLGVLTTIVAASYGGSQAVLLATLITVALVLGLLLFSLQTRIDFTPYTGMGCGLLLCLICFGFIAAFFPPNNTVDLVYAGGGALIFCFLLVVDLQLMMSGKRVQIGPDDYVPAAIKIYLDIINIFVFVLRLVQGRRW